MQDVGRHAGLVHQLHRAERDERSLFRGLRDHGVARDQRGGDLPAEDREREVPGADAHEDAAAAETQFVRFAGRARQRLRLQPFATDRGVVAAEVDRLAHLEVRIEHRAAALAHDQRGEFVVGGFPRVGYAVDDVRAGVDPARFPAGKGRERRADRASGVGGAGVGDRPDDLRERRRVADARAAGRSARRR